MTATTMANNDLDKEPNILGKRKKKEYERETCEYKNWRKVNNNNSQLNIIMGHCTIKTKEEREKKTRANHTQSGRRMNLN